MHNVGALMTFLGGVAYTLVITIISRRQSELIVISTINKGEKVCEIDGLIDEERERERERERDDCISCTLLLFRKKTNKGVSTAMFCTRLFLSVFSAVALGVGELTFAFYFMYLYVFLKCT